MRRTGTGSLQRWGRAARNNVAWVVAGLMTLAAAGFAFADFTQPSAVDAAATAPAPPAPTTTTVPGSAGGAGAPGAKASHRGALGQVTGVTSEGFTMNRRASGRPLTVVLSSSTQYGTTKYPTTRDQIQAGAEVGVRGQVSGGTLTAERVVVFPPGTLLPGQSAGQAGSSGPSGATGPSSPAPAGGSGSLGA